MGLAILLLPLTQTRQLRDDLAEVEAAMNALADSVPHRNYKLHIPEDRARLKTLLESEEEEEEEGEYEDFPQEPTVLQGSYWLPGNPKDQVIYRTSSKRYLGIEIPDYVSSPSKGSILKTIQNRMKEAGRK